MRKLFPEQMMLPETLSAAEVTAALFFRKNIMEDFIFAFNSVMPIVLVSVLGYILKVVGFLKEDWLKKGNSFVFKVCLPCLLFMNVYNIESFKDFDWSVVIFSEIVLVAMFLAGFIIVKILIKDDRKKGVVHQCVFRSNFAIIGLSLVESLGGSSKAIGMAAVLSAFSIPTLNIMAVIVLSLYIDNSEKENVSGLKRLKNVLLSIYQNPLIRGIVIALIVKGIESLLPPLANGEAFTFRNFTYTKSIISTVNSVSKIASPLALIILGGRFSFSAVKGMLGEIILGTSLRLVFVPVVAFTMAIYLSANTEYFNFGKDAYPALIALFSSPVAVSSAIMAEEMKNDGVLAGQYVVWTSLFSMLSIFVIVFILKRMGLV